MAYRIEKSIELKKPLSRVWKALTDHKEFGEWFGVKIEGPFTVGKVSRGHMTYPGYEHLLWESLIKEMSPESRFSFSWHPYAIDTSVDYSKEPHTLVEFTLKKSDEGCVLTVVETGFEDIPEKRRLEAFRMNDEGWAEQILNIDKYVAAH